MFLLEIGFLLGVAVFCALGWARAIRRVEIAQRKEEARDQSQLIFDERVRLAEDVGRFGTWAWDPVSELFSLSAGAASMNGLGNRPMEVTGAELYATVHADDR